MNNVIYIEDRPGSTPPDVPLLSGLDDAAGSWMAPRLRLRRAIHSGSTGTVVHHRRQVLPSEPADITGFSVFSSLKGVLIRTCEQQPRCGRPL